MVQSKHAIVPRCIPSKIVNCISIDISEIGIYTWVEHAIFMLHLTF
jgi:hypothetical protein